MSESALHDLRTIFADAVRSVDPAGLIRNHTRLDGEHLSVTTETESVTVDLRRFDRILLFGAGKATARMAAAVEELLGERLTEGIISVKYGHTEPLSVVSTIEAGHPVPDENSLLAAERIKELAGSADEKTLILNLISGGGSALLASPLSAAIEGETLALDLNEIQDTTSVLLACGAAIEEINCIRKHLSSIKGGRLAELCHPAMQINLLLSDVVGDRLDTIASGLTTHDTTTYGQALRILKKYDIAGKIPSRALKLLQAGNEGLIPETPKPGNRIFSQVRNLIIGSNRVAVQAALRAALRLGYNGIALSSRITGEAKEAARVFTGIAKEVRAYGTPVQKPACIIWGGETTVTLQGEGQGGRNQEFALAFLLELQEFGLDEDCGITMLAASTDGNDGPTDAAGGFASTEVLRAAAEKGLDPLDYLRNNDSYTFFEKTGFLHRTGPTNTNVCDIQTAIVGQPEEPGSSIS
jgi:hydroxypyruvate reductase